MSASAPAGSAIKNIGRLDAVWISDTISGDFDNEVISHAAPTFCIQVPRLEASAAIQSARNTRWRSGAHDEGGVTAPVSWRGVWRAPPNTIEPLIQIRSSESMSNRKVRRA